MWNILEYQEVASTNALAKDMLVAGNARHGDVLQARHQTAGKGRLSDRAWVDQPGTNLLMSLVLEKLPVPRVELIQYLAALSVASALRSVLAGGESALTITSELQQNASHGIRIKWPNDVLLHGKKICGILSEGIWHSQYLRGVIVGIGINVGQSEFEGKLHRSATSLKQSGHDIDVNELRDLVLDTIEQELARLEQLPGYLVQMTIIAALRNELAWMSKLPPLHVYIREDAELEGMLYEGIADNGALLLRHRDGTLVTMNAGSLEWSDTISDLAGRIQ